MGRFSAQRSHQIRELIGDYRKVEIFVLDGSGALLVTDHFLVSLSWRMKPISGAELRLDQVTSVRSEGYQIVVEASGVQRSYELDHLYSPYKNDEAALDRAKHAAKLIQGLADELIRAGAHDPNTRQAASSTHNAAAASSGPSPGPPSGATSSPQTPAELRRTTDQHRSSPDETLGWAVASALTSVRELSRTPRIPGGADADRALDFDMRRDMQFVERMQPRMDSPRGLNLAHAIDILLFLNRSDVNVTEVVQAVIAEPGGMLGVNAAHNLAHRLRNPGAERGDDLLDWGGALLYALLTLAATPTPLPK